ncbi:amidohydrolase family protein [Virgibacillus kimchii]
MEYLEHLSLSVLPNMFSGQKYTDKLYPGMNMYMQITIQRLAAYFSCEPTVGEVVKKRNELAKNFSSFTKTLFRDVNLEGLIVDFGYPTNRIPQEDFSDTTGLPLWEVYRIEPLIDSLREKKFTFADFIERYRAVLKNELKKDHVVGLKSIIAYRSGLEIQKMDQGKALDDYEKFLVNKRITAKSLRDYCFHIAMEECNEAGKVMHIHTGVGDGEIVLPKASPSLLVDLLRDPKYENTKVHLVHGGYPWMEEAAFLTSVLPNVYMDISLQNPFIGHGVKRIISQVFEFAPFNKVMYGSDAFTVPEMNWLGVLLFKECFKEVLDEWVKKDFMDTDTAQLIGEMVLYRNFENVYKDHLSN